MNRCIQRKWLCPAVRLRWWQWLCPSVWSFWQWRQLQPSPLWLHSDFGHYQEDLEFKNGGTGPICQFSNTSGIWAQHTQSNIELRGFVTIPHAIQFNLSIYEFPPPQPWLFHLCWTEVSCGLLSRLPQKLDPTATTHHHLAPPTLARWTHQWPHGHHLHPAAPSIRCCLPVWLLTPDHPSPSC